MARYLDLAGFKALSVMPSPDIDLIEGLESGWVQAQIDLMGGYLDSRLAKRYAVPFGTDPGSPLAPLRVDVPQAILNWIASLVTLRCYAKRGINPSSAELWYTSTVIEPAKQAEADIKEAPDSNTGLFDLPLKDSQLIGSGVTRSGPLAYTENSPYVWIDIQKDAAVDQDDNKMGVTS